MDTNKMKLTIDDSEYDLPYFNQMVIAQDNGVPFFIHYKENIPVGVSVVNKDFLRKLQGSLNIILQNLS